MNRRAALLALLALGAMSPPPVARAQVPDRVWRIGYLGPSAETAPHLLKAFQDGLADFGYVAGRNAVVDYRWTNAGRGMTSESTMLANARDLVARKSTSSRPRSTRRSRQAAKTRGIALQVVGVRSAAELDAAFAALDRATSRSSSPPSSSS